jgi:digeranylgeranylglycerophospholipid reductase
MDYDVIICGAGPAGLSTGISTLFFNKNARILIIESREEVGEDKCAEGLSESWFWKMPDYGLFLHSKLDQKCFESGMFGMALYSPNGKIIKIRTKDRQGWMLNKDYFLKNLAKIFEWMGGEIRTGISIFRPLVKGNRLEGIETVEGEMIYGKYVVDATGLVQSVWRKTLNITEPLEKKDIEVCFQYKVLGCKLKDHDLIHIYFNNDIAPGGYGWVFPKGPNKANVGLGCQGSKVKNALPFMEKFWKKLKIDGNVISKRGGTVDTFNIPDTFVWSNLACVGSSARFTNPLHGGGTGPALFSGYVLGKHIGNSLKENADTDESLLNYQEEMKSTLGKEHTNVYRIKNLIQKCDDNELEIILESITKDEWLRAMNLTKSDMLRIIGRISKRSLKLGLKIARSLGIG